MPSLLFINRVFPPGSGATGQLLAEMSEELARNGWRVHIVSSSARASRAETGFAGRFLAYLWLYPQFLLRALRTPRTDVVVTMTDPPLQIVLGPLLSFLKGSQHVHWAQDLYPELAEELGVLKKDGFVARRLRALSTAAMRRTRRVVAVGECMKQRLIGRGVPAGKITVIPNWGSFRQSIAPHEVTELRRARGWESRFVVMYSGNLGLAHTFHAIVDAADRLQRLAPGVLFVFVGDGPRADHVRSEAARRCLANVCFLPPEPKERYELSLAAADLHLASMRDELCGLVVPSKVYGALALGRPCFFIGPLESEAARLLTRHKVGRVFGTQEGGALAESIALWAKDASLAQATTHRLASVATQFRLAPAALALLRVLEDAAAPERHPLPGRARPLSRASTYTTPLRLQGELPPGELKPEIQTGRMTQ